MLTYLQAIILGGLQGITELFPISSLGHSVIFPKLFGWNLDQRDNFFLIFLVATHLATSLVLFFFYFSDWVKIIKGIFRSLVQREIRSEDTYAKLGWLIIVSTIPVGILGILFEEKLKQLFASPQIAALFLIANGVLLFGMEKLSQNRKAKDKIVEQDNVNDNDSAIAKLSWTQAVGVGFSETLALIPGFSRTGASLGGGLLAGLDHESSLRYSFLLATPVIFAAAVLKLPELFNASNQSQIGPLIVGSLISAFTAFLSVKFLTKYFKTKKLTPFAIYCVAFGIVASIIFLLR